MAQITFTIPDAFIPRVVDAFCSEFGYDPDAVPSVTKAAFTKAKIRDYIKEITIRSERKLAHQLATEAIQDEIDGVEIT